MLSARICLLACVLIGLLHACGGGGGGGETGSASPVAAAPANPAPTPAPPAQPSAVTSVTLQSEPGDPLGDGLAYRYTPADADIVIESKENRLIVQVHGDAEWTGVFQTGGSAHALKPGEYLAMERFVDGMDQSRSAMAWWGNGQSCNTATGWAIIDSVEYANTSLVAVSLRFARYCNGSTAALRGEVRYSMNDRSGSASPVTAVPSDLWRPPAAVSAAVGNYAYFESTEGDHVGLGKTILLDGRSARIEVNGISEDIAISVVADEIWRAEFNGVARLGKLIPGYYPGVKQTRFNNPAKGGMSWVAAGRGCATSTGWFVVDAVSLDHFGGVERLDLRFEQHCEGRAAPLRGALHYVKPVPMTVAVPGSSPGAWRAPAGLVPADANFLFTDSDIADPLAGGRTELQSSHNAAFEVSATGNQIVAYSKGNQTWGIRFTAPSRFTHIVPGIYDNIAPTAGSTGASGMLWVSAGNYGCDTGRGWVVVDNATYSAGQLVGLELRFEQVCDPAVPDGKLRRGHLRWRADVADAFPGPSSVIPATFWRPARTLPAGNTMYMTSDPSNFVGIGEVLYTPLDAAITVTEQAGKVDISVRGDTSWTGAFETMSTAGKIVPGYYEGLNSTMRPARGRFHWSGDGRGCQSDSGVVVDSAVYTGGRLTELKLRFEMYCDTSLGGLRGQLNWSANDVRQPAGPGLTAPASLWRAPPGSLPQSKKYIYVESDGVHPATGGNTYLFSAENATMRSQSLTNYHDIPGSYFSLTADSGTPTGGRFAIDFQTMRSVGQLQPGFYDHLQRYGFHNTAFGGLDIHSHLALGCNKAMGWMMLDKVVYTSGRLSAIHGRFMTYCTDYASGYAFGEFNWEE